MRGRSLGHGPSPAIQVQGNNQNQQNTEGSKDRINRSHHNEGVLNSNAYQLSLSSVLQAYNLKGSRHQPQSKGASSSNNSQTYTSNGNPYLLNGLQQQGLAPSQQSQPQQQRNSQNPSPSPVLQGDSFTRIPYAIKNTATYRKGNNLMVYGYGNGNSPEPIHKEDELNISFKSQKVGSKRIDLIKESPQKRVENQLTKQNKERLQHMLIGSRVFEGISRNNDQQSASYNNSVNQHPSPSDRLVYGVSTQDSLPKANTLLQNGGLLLKHGSKNLDINMASDYHQQEQDPVQRKLETRESKLLTSSQSDDQPQLIPAPNRPVAATGSSRPAVTSLEETGALNNSFKLPHSIGAFLGNYTEKKSPKNNPKLALINHKQQHSRNKSDAKLLKNFLSQNDQVVKIYGPPQLDIIPNRDEKYTISTQSQPLSKSIVDKYCCKTRMGMIPNMKKSNQDNHMAVKDLAGIKGLWMFGVMDGHGINGHLVSDFVRKNLPNFLANMITGVHTSTELNNPRKSMSSAKRQALKKQNIVTRNSNYLPPLVSSNNSMKQRHQQQSVSAILNGEAGNGDDDIYQAGSMPALNNYENWMISDPQVRDSQIKEAFKLTQERLEQFNDAVGLQQLQSQCGTIFLCVVILGTQELFFARVIKLMSGISHLQAEIISPKKWMKLIKEIKLYTINILNWFRIRKCNGRIEQSRIAAQGTNIPQFFGPKRVWLKTKQAPGLAMTRSLGDLVAKSVGVTYEPEIKAFPNLIQRQDKVVIIASDGLWDRIPNDEVTRMIIPFYERRDPEGAANRLVQEAAMRWQRDQGMIDDITVMIVFLNAKPQADKNQPPQQSQPTYQQQFQAFQKLYNTSSQQNEQQQQQH